MKKEIQDKLTEIRSRIEEAIRVLNLAEKESELDVLEEQSQKPEFWNDAENAKNIMQKINDLKSIIAPWRKMEKDAQELIELLTETNEEDELFAEIKGKAGELEKELEDKETETYFSGKYDEMNAVLSIYAGAGGVDAQDWAEMLLSMFLKYAQNSGLKPNIISLTPGTEAGLKSVSVEVSGPFAYGLLRSERGVHRLVRISPYDADKARHTSFALVEVVPEIPAEDLALDEKDLRIDTFRAGGHGGQGVNTTDSAVRITHIPTGITVSVQNERSQLQNKATAMKILKSRIKAAEEAEKEKELNVIRGENLSAEWGSQIRSYVLHPYTMVKDHRTGKETSNVNDVLSGNLKPFVESYLKENRG